MSIETYTPEYAEYLDIDILTDGEDQRIYEIRKDGVWVGEHIEKALKEQHGDRYISEHNAKVRAEYKTDLAEYLAHDLLVEGGWL